MSRESRMSKTGLMRGSKAATPFLNNALGMVATRFERINDCWFASSTNGKIEETRVGVKTGRVFCFLAKNWGPSHPHLEWKVTDVKWINMIHRENNWDWHRLNFRFKISQLKVKKQDQENSQWNKNINCQVKLTRHTMVKVYNKVSQRLFCITGKRDPKHKTLLWIHAWKTRDETRRTQRGRVRAHTGVVQVCTLPCANKLQGSYPIRQPSFSKRFSLLFHYL